MTGKRLIILEIGPGEFPHLPGCENIVTGVTKTNDFCQCLRKYLVFLAVYEFSLSGQASTRPQAFCSITRIYKISFLQ